MRLSKFAALSAALIVTGCASAPHPSTGHPVAPSAAHPCNSADFVMQCVTAPRLTLLPLGTRTAAYGVDFGWGGPSVSFLHGRGVRFAASYLSPDGEKNWRAWQVHEYHRAGIATVAVWESSATRALDGYGAGVADARTAAAQAAALGEPRNRPVYFAVDFENASSAIDAYFRGADSVLGRSRVGAGYGGIGTIRDLFNHRLVSYGWQTAAWSGGVWDSRAQIEQYGFTEALDYDRATTGDYGQWPYSPPAPPKPRPRPKPPAPNQRRAQIAHLRALARRHHCYRRRKPHACDVWAVQVRALER